MGIIQHLLKNKERSPNKPAIIFNDVVITYKDFTGMVCKLSSGFRKVGIGEGTHIGLQLHNSVEFVTSMFAAADIGATIVPMSSSLSSKDLVIAINITNIDYLVGWHASLKDVLERTNKDFPLNNQNCIAVGGVVDGCLNFEELVDTAPVNYQLGNLTIDNEKDFILTMTSGSTSAPKPIVFTQGTKMRRCYGAQKSYNITENDIILCGTPLYHSISQRLVLLPLITGGTSVIMQRFTPNNWFSLVAKHNVTFTIAVSSQLENILRELSGTNVNLKSLRSIVSCCALLNNEIKTLLIKRIKCEFHECYGTSEVGVVSNLAPQNSKNKMHTVGSAVPGVEIKITDDQKKPVAIGQVGEITCKSNMCFSRYYMNELATKQSIKDGFFHTGDMGYLDEDGYLVFSGRKKEVIITGGTNVYPKDVESVLNEHSKIKESAVIGVEDKRFGEAILALIISEKEETLTSRELQYYCLHRLADYQQPLAYEFVDDFPRTELGKVVKRKLVEQMRGYDLTKGLRAMIKSGTL